MSLQLQVDGPSYESATNGTVHDIDASAILDEQQLHLFATNRDQHEEAEVVVSIADLMISGLQDGELLRHIVAGDAVQLGRQPATVAASSSSGSTVVTRQHGGLRCIARPPAG